MNVQQAIQSQYLAAFKMLREAIVRCPPSIWNARRDQDPVWYKVQHVLYWAHVDVRATSTNFSRWKGHGRPRPGRPTSKDELLAYLTHVETAVAEPGSASDLVGAAGVRGNGFKNLRRAITSIRHIQQHTGELYERLGSREKTVLHWTEQVTRKKR